MQENMNKDQKYLFVFLQLLIQNTTIQNTTIQNTEAEIAPGHKY